MVNENDKLEIPEKYRKMSVSELRREKERIYKDLNVQKAADARKKVSESPILFKL